MVVPDFVGPVLVEEMEGKALGVGEKDGGVGFDIEAESGWCRIRGKEERRGGPGGRSSKGGGVGGSGDVQRYGVRVIRGGVWLYRPRKGCRR